MGQHHPFARGGWVRILAAAVSLSACLVGWVGQTAAIGPTSPYYVWVYDDSDPDYTNPPFNDTLTILDSNGAIVGLTSSLNTAQTVGGHRTLSITRSGRHALLVEYPYSPGSALSMYDRSGQLMWFMRTEEDVHAVDFSLDGTAYALAGSTVYGDEILEIDPRTRTIVDRASLGGFDLVVDDAHEAIWLVGSDVKKLNRDLELQFSLDSIGWVAVAVDYTSDGGVWISERYHPDVNGSRNRVFRVSADGAITHSIGVADPYSLSVDRRDDSLWVVSGENLVKFDAQGQLLFQIVSGRSFSVRVSEVDGSAWVAGWGDVRHYASDGMEIARISGFANGQAWLALSIESLVPDTDNDGLANADEVNVYGTNPSTSDSDGDGLSDSAEVEVYPTDPADSDSDDDGLSDSEELNLYPTDPLDSDSDDDGLLDGEEVNLYPTDPLDPDGDDDGLLDGDEVNVHGTDPLDSDSDDDGLRDSFEVMNGFNPLLGGEELEDPDLDGLDNLAEQAAGTNPHDADTDDDGLSDADELNLYETNPNDLDSDDDGLSDGEEVAVYGTDPLNLDSDRDRLSDGFEVVNGFDPVLGGEETQDPDLDGLDNLGEQTSSTDPHDADTDNDGLSDADEVLRVRTIPFVPTGSIANHVTANGLRSVFASDLDGDGDPDVLSASAYDGRIAWYENRLDEASAGFGSQQVIVERYPRPYADGANSVFAADLDGDGDPDVLSATPYDDKIAWYENRLDEASADFGPQQAITTAADYAVDVFAVDLDGDGDPDVLSASRNDDKIAWYENRLDEANSDFGPQQVITTAADAAFSVFAADLDRDGDSDVLSASSSQLAWYESRLDEASADIGPQQVIADGGYSAVFAADLDGDGDPDVLSPSAWYENRLDEASEDFGPQQVITTAGVLPSIFAADLDRDGDPDVLSAAAGSGLAWYENRLDEASADFGPQPVSSGRGIRSVFAADLDGDGDQDALSAYSGGMIGCCGDSLVLWENPGTDPLDPDSDDDGLVDGDEVNLYSTDPNDPETDNDGLLDGDEVNVYATDPANPDTDGDGLRDGEEINVHGTNPNDADTDGDGLLDPFELTNGFDPLLGGEETQDPDLDGLDNLGEQTAGTDPFDSDSDDDRLSDGDEVNVHGTDPADPDSDGDGIFDDLEIAAGTDPNNRNDPGPGARFPMLYKGSLRLYVRGNRTCPYYCYSNALARPVAGPLIGSGAASVTLHALGSPFGFTLPAGALRVETPSLSGELPPIGSGYYASIQLKTHPNSSFANNSGIFAPGGGPGSHSFGYYYQTSIMSAYTSQPRWRITPGPKQFGGTMRLLGAIDEMRNLLHVGSGAVDFYAHAPNPFSALGGRCNSTTGCPSLPVSHSSRVVQYYTALKNLYTTALVNAWGYAWTTGRVYVTAHDYPYFGTWFTRNGYDNRTPLGQGFIQLVSPHIAHWNFASLPLDRSTGAVAVLNIEIQFVPEPRALLMVAAGASVLVLLHRMSRQG